MHHLIMLNLIDTSQNFPKLNSKITTPHSRGTPLTTHLSFNTPLPPHLTLTHLTFITTPHTPIAVLNYPPLRCSTVSLITSPPEDVNVETCFLFSALSVKRYRASGFSLNGRDGRRKGGEGRGKRESGGKEGGRGGREGRGNKGREGWMIAYRS